MLPKIKSLFFGGRLSAAAAEEFGDILIAADVAPTVAGEIVKKLKASPDNAKAALRSSLLEYSRRLAPGAAVKPVPNSSYLIVGANGAGKTTTIGKLAKQWTDQGRRVIIGACDTFRAAAVGQLDIWAKRAGAEVVHGTEPAAVAYKAVESAMRVGAVVILDTAGRLHNRDDLMQELAKITRVVKKADSAAPSETWLALDAAFGQNALAQIEYFDKVAPLTGLVITKMDGTSKGGFLISYAAGRKNPLPVRYVGYGEKIEDLRPFSADEYVDKLLGLD